MFVFVLHWWHRSCRQIFPNGPLATGGRGTRRGGNPFWVPRRTLQPWLLSGVGVGKGIPVRDFGISAVFGSGLALLV